MSAEDPQVVASELRRRGLPVHRADDVIGTDEQLREIFTSARLGGWDGTRAPRPRHINLGRLIAVGGVSSLDSRRTTP
ncbi:hypothetical protein ACFQS1_19825 [Paractinoplanes rhizophilus]|uniref:Uncharacterized protein n=1 Tax=Paractinoplanes rhizophilus TaxID=1416877 RepID=A0ABW2HSV3_9ACTN